jgi:hypothetical protein
VAEHRLRGRGPSALRSDRARVPHYDERLACYTLRIGLDDMAYSAFRERWDKVEQTTRRTLEIARAD